MPFTVTRRPEVKKRLCGWDKTKRKKPTGQLDFRYNANSSHTNRKKSTKLHHSRPNSYTLQQMYIYFINNIIIFSRHHGKLAKSLAVHRFCKCFAIVCGSPQSQCIVWPSGRYLDFSRRILQ